MAASNKALPTPFPRNSCGTYIPQITPLWRLLIPSSRWKLAIPTNVFPSNAPKVASSGAVSLLRSPWVTPAMPRSSISSYDAPKDSGLSRNALNRMFQNASASASVNLRTSICSLLLTPFTNDENRESLHLSSYLFRRHASRMVIRGLGSVDLCSECVEDPIHVSDVKHPI